MAKTGRPPVITEIVLQKLEEVFALGGTDKEACIYADISPATLYNYQEFHPDFLERKELLKQKPILLARRTINDNLMDDLPTARWYIERRDRDFNPKTEVDVTSKGDKITTNELALTAAEQAYIQHLDATPEPTQSP